MLRIKNVDAVIGVLIAKKDNYDLVVIHWNDSKNQVNTAKFNGSYNDMIALAQKNGVFILPGIVTKHKINKDLLSVMNIMTPFVISLRSVFEEKYGYDTDLCGYCIQASEMLQAVANAIGFNAKTVEGWCKFDDECYGSDRNYDPHTWLEIEAEQEKFIYVDITADQFNYGMYQGNEFDGVLILDHLPHGMTYNEPI